MRPIHQAAFTLVFKLFQVSHSIHLYIRFLPLKTLTKMRMTAMISKICIKPAATLKTKPRTHNNIIKPIIVHIMIIPLSSLL